MLPHVPGAILFAHYTEVMSEHTEGPADVAGGKIEWQLVEPVTISEAIITRDTLAAVARLLGYDPDTVMSIEMDAHEATIRRAVFAPGADGDALLQFTEHRKYVR